MDRALWGPLLLIVLCLALGRVRRCRELAYARRHLARTSRRFAWQPRTPDDCASAGRRALAPRERHAGVPVRPWAEVKTRRGAPKRRSTEWACFGFSDRSASGGDVGLSTGLELRGAQIPQRRVQALTIVPGLSMYAKIAAGAAARVGQSWRSTSATLSVAKHDSATAWS